ncbi:thioesterase [Leptospira perolatii]|uniref:Thioesterase n=1 Tax=Leptospira perolatii TaxID=2023191 RepID=A0A2M9ZNZ4_9LEPT|nr:thioesterase family protein [Leptospira perolatii]PJZ70891.1 thioesterase [Leptospira perolatii]PJZ73787.1 thioesterase [Leptospira perolatii]
MHTYQSEKLVRFQHCDPGGVVFTPQYFNLFTEVMEDWFDEVIDFSFSEMVVKQNYGVPAMKIVAKFYKPSFLGDRLVFETVLKRLKRNNIELQLTAQYLGEKRCTVNFLLGFADLRTKTLTNWPDEVYIRLKNLVTEIQ